MFQKEIVMLMVCFGRGVFFLVFFLGCIYASGKALATADVRMAMVSFRGLGVVWVGLVGDGD